MARIKLAAMDVDGTLLRSDLTLSPAVMRALESLRDAGVTVAVVTGRTMGELIEFRQLLPWIRYYVISNGTTALDTERNCIFYKRYLPLETARAIERESRNYSVMTEVYADGVSYVNRNCWEQSGRYTPEDLHHPSLASGRVPLESIGTLLEAREIDIEKFHILFEHKQDLPALVAFCSGFDVETVLSIHDGLEITRRGVDKGSGLAALCDHIHISPKKQPRSETACRIYRCSGAPASPSRWKTRRNRCAAAPPSSRQTTIPTAQFGRSSRFCARADTGEYVYLPQELKRAVERSWTSILHRAKRSNSAFSAFGRAFFAIYHCFGRPAGAQHAVCHPVAIVLIALCK